MSFSGGGGLLCCLRVSLKSGHRVTTSRLRLRPLKMWVCCLWLISYWSVVVMFGDVIGSFDLRLSQLDLAPRVYTCSHTSGVFLWPMASLLAVKDVSEWSAVIVHPTERLWSLYCSRTSSEPESGVCLWGVCVCLCV